MFQTSTICRIASVAAIFIVSVYIISEVEVKTGRSGWAQGEIMFGENEGLSQHL